MGKVVYLLGAGASFGRRDPDNPEAVFQYDYVVNGIGKLLTECQYPKILEGLPIVTELPGRMEYIVGKIYENYPLDRTDEQCVQARGLAENLKWLIIESKRHATIDTFAKKLWLTGNQEDYNKLKRTLCAYFMLEQMFNKPDKRYDAFFASILGRDAKDLPSNVRILSWNYDIQLELAYAEFLQNNDLNNLEKALLFFQKVVDSNNYRMGDGFRVIKLNGSALMYDASNRNVVSPVFDNQTLSAFEIGKVSSLINSGSYCCALSFAWEDPDDVFLEKIRKNIEGAEALVVIGYSFPYFNRTIDKFIIDSMSRLQTIYIQDKDPDEKEQSVLNLLSSTASIIHKPKIVKLYHTQQFYLPPEL